MRLTEKVCSETLLWRRKTNALLPESKDCHRRVGRHHNKSRDRLPLSHGRSWNHDHEVIIQPLFGERRRSGVLVELHTADPPERRGREGAVQPFLAGADEAVLPGLLRVALSRLSGLQRVVELHRSALCYLDVPLASRHYTWRAEPAGQRLQLSHAQPQLPFQLASAVHLLGLVESKHVHAGQLVDGTVVVPVPPCDIEQNLDFGLGQVNPGIHEECLHLPVEGEDRGGGKSPRALKEL